MQAREPSPNVVRTITRTYLYLKCPTNRGYMLPDLHMNFSSLIIDINQSSTEP